MEPLTQVPYQHITDRLVRLRTPLTSDSLFHAIVLAVHRSYRTGYLNGNAIDPIQLVQDIVAVVDKVAKPDRSLDGKLASLASLINYTIYIVNRRLEIVSSYGDYPTAIVVIDLGNHYETLGLMEESISTLFTDVSFLEKSLKRRGSE
jgi:hypothetical protein